MEEYLRDKAKHRAIATFTFNSINCDGKSSIKISKLKSSIKQVVKEINPDIEIASQQTSDFTRALVGNLAVFDYATEFYNQNSFASMNDFSAENIDYEKFKQRMAASGLDFYETTTERELQKIMSTKEATDFGENVSEEYKRSPIKYAPLNEE